MVVAMALFGREVALRRRTEVERDALLESERAARSEAERASRLKDDFLATLSHELRTPLAAILGWSAVLRNAFDGSERERALDTIERNARAQARLIDDLLDMTRLQAGALHLALDTVALAAPVHAAFRACARRPTPKAWRSSCTPMPIRRASRRADRMQQVVANLLVNAVKFTPAGGRIAYRCARRSRTRSSSWPTRAKASTRHSCRTSSRASGRPIARLPAGTAGLASACRSF